MKANAAVALAPSHVEGGLMLRRNADARGARRRDRCPQSKGHEGGNQRECRAAIEARIPAPEPLEEQWSAPGTDKRRVSLRGIDDGVVRRRVPGAEVVSSGGRK